MEQFITQSAVSKYTLGRRAKRGKGSPTLSPCLHLINGDIMTFIRKSSPKNIQQLKYVWNIFETYLPI